jgi:hypothetical protein
VVSCSGRAGVNGTLESTWHPEHRWIARDWIPGKRRLPGFVKRDSRYGGAGVSSLVNSGARECGDSLLRNANYRTEIEWERVVRAVTRAGRRMRNVHACEFYCGMRSTSLTLTFAELIGATRNHARNANERSPRGDLLRFCGFPPAATAFSNRTGYTGRLEQLLAF